MDGHWSAGRRHASLQTESSHPPTSPRTLLALAGQVEIGHFLEASSRELPPPYDLSLGEGSIAAPADLERISQVREQSRYLVTCTWCPST
ncbi:hypothetical protein [Kitasatospora sp. NPDC086791]|uniref:hypothetical protein n=1 Tax=Kitasatospora sp. NPDC086791 TaxID=3155178 RepID=UPI00343B0512